MKEATPEAVGRAVALAAGAQKAKYGALQAGWMPATPDEQARRAQATTLGVGWCHLFHPLKWPHQPPPAVQSSWQADAQGGKALIKNGGRWHAVRPRCKRRGWPLTRGEQCNGCRNVFHPLVLWQISDAYADTGAPADTWSHACRGGPACSTWRSVQATSLGAPSALLALAVEGPCGGRA